MGINKYKREYFRGEVPFIKWMVSEEHKSANFDLLPLTILIFFSLISVNYINLIVTGLIPPILHPFIIFLITYSMYSILNRSKKFEGYKILMDSIIFTIHIYSLYIFSNLIFILFGSLFTNMYIGLGVVIMSYLLLSFYITYLDYIDWLVRYKDVAKSKIREIRLNKILK